jgi:hypothetical protein
MNDAVMGAAETVSREDRVGLGGEITIGKKQQLDPLPHLLLVYGRRMSREIYVRHIDLSRNLWHLSGVLRDIKFPATYAPAGPLEAAGKIRCP